MTTSQRRVGIIVVIFIIGFGAALLSRGGNGNHKPLGESPLIPFATISAPDERLLQFLDGDFRLIKDVQSLPVPILKAYTETGGARPVMANPGERFEATDVIRDESVPRKRLVFAGVSGSKCFVHYEQGGRGHSFRVAFFEIPSAEKMKPIWLGYCGPAKDVSDLRSQVRAGCPH
jgi:hypothetical protein